MSGLDQRLAQFIDGLSISFLGIVMVFFVLLVLIALITLIGKWNQYLEKKDQTSCDVEANCIEEVTSSTKALQQDDTEVIAVITATLASMMGTSTDQLVVRSLRKVNR